MIGIVSFLVLLLAGLGLWCVLREREKEADDQIPYQLIVQFKRDISANRVAEIHREHQCEVLHEDDAVGFAVLRSKRSAKQVLRKYLNLAEIEYAEPNYRFRALEVIPNDPYFHSYQYGPQLIQAPAAWEVTTSTPDIRIAVVDTGVQLTHPDLSGKLVSGYDFVSNDSIPDDPNGHGTHAAGIAAAATNNGRGIAGIAPNASILPVRVLDQAGNGSLDQVARGIIYAADQGVQVINLSLGAPYRAYTLQRAVEYAWNRGAVVVAAAGNDNSNTLNYPAAYPHVIAVASVDANDRKSTFSNYGDWVDVAAPGSEILSTYPNNNYAYLSGTSMAAPHAAGLAALLASQGKSNEEIRNTILSRSDPIPGTGVYWVHGRINADKAVRSDDV